MKLSSRNRPVRALAQGSALLLAALLAADSFDSFSQLAERSASAAGALDRGLRGYTPGVPDYFGETTSPVWLGASADPYDAGYATAARVVKRMLGHSVVDQLAQRLEGPRHEQALSFARVSR